MAASTRQINLAERMRAGEKVRLLADPGLANRSFSAGLDVLGMALPDRFCKPEQAPPGAGL